MHKYVITVIVIDPTTQTDPSMVSAHTAGDGMLNIIINIIYIIEDNISSKERKGLWYCYYLCTWIRVDKSFS